jgi:hypothetical protein
MGFTMGALLNYVTKAGPVTADTVDEANPLASQYPTTPNRK